MTTPEREGVLRLIAVVVQRALAAPQHETCVLALDTIRSALAMIGITGEDLQTLPRAEEQ